MYLSKKKCYFYVLGKVNKINYLSYQVKTKTYKTPFILCSYVVILPPSVYIMCLYFHLSTWPFYLNVSQASKIKHIYYWTLDRSTVHLKLAIFYKCRFHHSLFQFLNIIPTYDFYYWNIRYVRVIYHLIICSFVPFHSDTQMLCFLNFFTPEIM